MFRKGRLEWNEAVEVKAGRGESTRLVRAPLKCLGNRGRPLEKWRASSRHEDRHRDMSWPTLRGKRGSVIRERNGAHAKACQKRLKEVKSSIASRIRNIAKSLAMEKVEC